MKTKKADDLGFGLCPGCGHPIEINVYCGLMSNHTGELLGIRCAYCGGVEVTLVDMQGKQRRLAEAQYQEQKDVPAKDFDTGRHIGHYSEHIRNSPHRE